MARQKRIDRIEEKKTGKGREHVSQWKDEREEKREEEKREECDSKAILNQTEDGTREK